MILLRTGLAALPGTAGLGCCRGQVTVDPPDVSTRPWCGFRELSTGREGHPGGGLRGHRAPWGLPEVSFTTCEVGRTSLPRLTHSLIENGGRGAPSSIFREGAAFHKLLEMFCV